MDPRVQEFHSGLRAVLRRYARDFEVTNMPRTNRDYIKETINKIDTVIELRSLRAIADGRDRVNNEFNERASKLMRGNRL